MLAHDAIETPVEATNPHLSDVHVKQEAFSSPTLRTVCTCLLPGRGLGAMAWFMLW